MELKGETQIAASRQAVWEALNDPAVLARCIEGVESLTKAGDDRFDGVLNARVGPVRAKFTGAVTLSDLDPPNGYTISGEGKGGVAGFARGAAKVRLADEDGGTRLSYDVTSNVGGKLAQLGSRLIEGAARGYADSFFARLKAELEQPAAAQPEPILNPTNDAANNAAELAAARLRKGPASDYAVPEKLGLGRTGWLALALVVVALAVWLMT